MSRIPVVPALLGGGRGLTLILMAAVAQVGCSPVVGLHSPSGPAQPEPLPPQAPSGAVSEAPPQPPLPMPAMVSPMPDPGPISMDPILDSPWARTSEMEARVQKWIESFQTREASLFRTSLARMGRYQGMVMEELETEGLPPSLAFLPIVESWYNPRAVSWVGAAGLWQFMPPTARGMGLRVDRLIDERRDPYRSTPLALSYLSGLNQQFDSWFLALAAYNAGPGRLERVLRNSGQTGSANDGAFLEVLDKLPRETRDFVPRFIAAARIGMDPAAYGFDDVVKEGPWSFDLITIPDATSLDVVAKASEVDQGTLEELNPKLLRGLTPAGVPTRLRVPEGVADRFSQKFASIPPEERVTFVEHSVARGETLTHIARMYGVSVEDLQATNPTIQPRRMQIGQRVVVPKAPSVRGRLPSSGNGVAAGSGDRLMRYKVQSGDTLSGIALRHRVGLNDLLRWNSLSRTAVLHPGDEVRIYLPAG